MKIVFTLFVLLVALCLAYTEQSALDNSLINQLLTLKSRTKRSSLERVPVEIDGRDVEVNCVPFCIRTADGVHRLNCSAIQNPVFKEICGFCRIVRRCAQNQVFS